MSRTRGSAASLPRPPWTIDVRLPADLLAIPPRRGLLAIEDDSGNTLALAGGADLRRLARSRLDRGLDAAARVLALTVGSTFELDWAWLAAARHRLPSAWKAAADRYRCWFVQCDPDATHPRFVRAARPAGDASGVWIGPVATPRAAARFVELLEEAFDLCREHSILLQTPHGAACVYKEMGKCPAPCDGSVPMDVYLGQFRDAVCFATGGVAATMVAEKRCMNDAAAALDFETAERHRRRLAVLSPAAGREYTHMAPLDRFRYLAVHRGERPGAVRLAIVLGGWIAPWLDVVDDDAESAAAAIQAALAPWRQREVVLGGPADVNLGLVCRHLFQAPSDGRFLRLDEIDVAKIAAAVTGVREGNDGVDQKQTEP